MAYTIEYDREVADELDHIGKFHANRVLDAIESQLMHEPTKETRHKKQLRALEPPWDQLRALWQLSVAEYRVFYDVIEEQKLVVVRAVRHKPPHKSTDEIL